MTEFTKTLLGLGCIVAMIALPIVYWLDLPVVYVDYYNHQCVKVSSATEQFDCNNLPPKYDRIYVYLPS